MEFYSISRIEKRLQKLYASGDIFRSYMQEESFSPIKIALKKPKEQDLLQHFSLILQQKENLERRGYSLEYKEFHFKKIGVQKLPVFVLVRDIEAFLLLVNRKEEYAIFIRWYEYICKKYPKLKELFLMKPMLVIEHAKEWKKFVVIIDFFLKYKYPNIYIREISLQGIDTKYIQKHLKILDIILSYLLENEPLRSIKDFAFEKRYGLKYILPQLRFRILDENLHIAGCDDIALPIEQFERLKIECKKVFVIENKITFLSFVSVAKSIAIFGSGYGISMLKNTLWLQEKEIYYWGDIDMDGFAILSQMRSYFPQTKSFLMDSNTIEQYKSRGVNQNGAKELRLTNLTKEEDIILRRLASDYYGKNFRLEQEMIPFEYVKNNLLAKT